MINEWTGEVAKEVYFTLEASNQAMVSTHAQRYAHHARTCPALIRLCSFLVRACVRASNGYRNSPSHPFHMDLSSPRRRLTINTRGPSMPPLDRPNLLIIVDCRARRSATSYARCTGVPKSVMAAGVASFASRRCTRRWAPRRG